MTVPATMDLSQILSAAQSHDASVRGSGEASLASLEADAPTFFQALSSHIAANTNAPAERKLAGTCRILR